MMTVGSYSIYGMSSLSCGSAGLCRSAECLINTLGAWASGSWTHAYELLIASWKNLHSDWIIYLYL